jgi:hypothetical protein
MSYATPAQYIAELGAPDEASTIKKAIEICGGDVQFQAMPLK